MALEAAHLRNPLVLWASGFGLGFAPRAPGTWGSAGAVVVWWLWLADLPVLSQLAICGAYFVLGWWCSSAVCRRYDVHDAPQIVVDEVAGMWLGLVLLPAEWWIVLFAFLLFRWLDIAKPGPVGWLDRDVKGGLGVMLDDVMAGLICASVSYFSLWGLRTLGWVPFVSH